MKTRKNKIKFLKDAKELLVCIDMVNGFVKEGALAATSITRVVPRQRELLQGALESNDTGIVFIRDCHPENATEFKVYGPHCIEGTKETEVIDELKYFEPYALEYLKNSINLMYAPKFMKDLMKFNNLEKLRLMGCLSEVCVEQGAIGLRTFLDQLNKDTEVCVHADAIDTFDAPGHNADEVTEEALLRMEAKNIRILGRKKKNENI